MKVLIATTETQGAAWNDYAHALAGELVTPAEMMCANPRCGCDRGFAGLSSHRATTTAMVVDKPGWSVDDLREAITGYVESGWGDTLRQQHADDRTHLDCDCPTDADCWCLDDPDEIVADLVDDHLTAIVRVCESLPAGTVVDKQGQYVRTRRTRRAA